MNKVYSWSIVALRQYGFESDLLYKTVTPFLRLNKIICSIGKTFDEANLFIKSLAAFTSQLSTYLESRLSEEGFTCMTEIKKYVIVYEIQ